MCVASDLANVLCLVLTGVTWEEVGLFLLGRVAWAGRIRLVVRRGQERIVDIG